MDEDIIFDHAITELPLPPVHIYEIDGEKQLIFVERLEGEEEDQKLEIYFADKESGLCRFFASLPFVYNGGDEPVRREAPELIHDMIHLIFAPSKKYDGATRYEVWSKQLEEMAESAKKIGKS